MTNNKTKEIDEIKNKISSLDKQIIILNNGMPEIVGKIKKTVKWIEFDYSLVYELEMLTKSLKQAREERIRIRSEKWTLENTLKELEKGDN